MILLRFRALAAPRLQPTPWIEQAGVGPAGLFDGLAELFTAEGFALEVRPSIEADGTSHGWTDYLRRIVWVNASCDEAERIRILVEGDSKIATAPARGRATRRSPRRQSASTASMRYCETGAWSVKAGEMRTVAEFGLAAASRWLDARRPAWSVGTWAPFIASVELVISRIEAMVKMSQNRPPADIDGVITGLDAREDHAAAGAVRDAQQR